jgi:hypothetical protein
MFHVKHVDPRARPVPARTDRDADSPTSIRVERGLAGRRNAARTGERHLVNRGAVGVDIGPGERAADIGNGASGYDRKRCFT